MKKSEKQFGSMTREISVEAHISAFILKTWKSFGEFWFPKIFKLLKQKQICKIWDWFLLSQKLAGSWLVFFAFENLNISGENSFFFFKDFQTFKKYADMRVSKLVSMAQNPRGFLTCVFWKFENLWRIFFIFSLQRILKFPE